MSRLSGAAADAHANGDCWAPTCPACELEDQEEES